MSSLTMNEKYFLFIVSELVLVNPDNSQAVSALTLLLCKLNKLQKKKTCQSLSQPKPWCNDSSVLNLHHGYHTTIMMSRRLL